MAHNAQRQQMLVAECSMLNAQFLFSNAVSIALRKASGIGARAPLPRKAIRCLGRGARARPVLGGRARAPLPRKRTGPAERVVRRASRVMSTSDPLRPALAGAR